MDSILNAAVLFANFVVVPGISCGSQLALCGIAAMLVSVAPVAEVWRIAGSDLLWTVVATIATTAAVILVRRSMAPGRLCMAVTAAGLLAGYDVIGIFFDPAVDVIETVDPTKAGFLGGLGLPVILSWPAGGLFAVVPAALLVLAERALYSSCARMMRAIRDNEFAAAAMGKDITGRHLEIFVLGAAVMGLGGAMLTTLEGQFTPGSYQPLRFTFLIWVMVIIGESANNWGSILGGFSVWFVWIEAEPAGLRVAHVLLRLADGGKRFGSYLVAGAPCMRVCVMGVILLLVLRFSPGGLMPASPRRSGD